MYTSSLYAMLEAINIQTEAVGKFWIGSRFSNDGYIWEDGASLDLDNWEDSPWAKGEPKSGI